MIIDGSQLFTGTSNGASGGITSTSYTDAPVTGTQAASNIIDYGIVSGIPAGGATNPTNRDMGIGDDPALKLCVIVTTTFLTGTSLQLQLQYCPDNATGVTGTYYTSWTSQVFPIAQLVAGAVLANIDLPREYQFGLAGTAGGPWRWAKLNFITAGSSMTAGQVEAFVALDQEQAIFGGLSGIVARSGYPAGINVAN